MALKVTDRRDARLAAVLDSIGDVYFVLDRDWRLVMFNSAAEAFFGPKRERMLGRTIWEFYPRDAASPITQALEKAMSEGVAARVTASSRLKPGRTVDLRATPLGEDGIGVFDKIGVKTGIDFFDFPTVDGNGAGAITIGGDVIAAFTDNPGVAEFMEYMATPDAGAVWAAGGTIISPLKGVDSSVYEDVNELAVKEAEQVANATAVRFDGSDLLPAGTDLGAIRTLGRLGIPVYAVHEGRWAPPARTTPEPIRLKVLVNAVTRKVPVATAPVAPVSGRPLGDKRLNPG